MRTLRLLPLVLGLACEGRTVTSAAHVGPGPGDVPAAAARKLAQRRVFFGHQSVGSDIVAGLEAIAREQPDLGLRVVEGRSAEVLAAPGFAHALNGQNGQPLTKLHDFAEALEKGGLGSRADIALFKFCYVDFRPGTDVDAIFAAYRATLARLRAAFPLVTFVHVTSPLVVVQRGPRALLKRLLGKRPAGAEENVLRERYNALLRAEYSGREPLFDLAAVESTLPDGRPVRFEDGGATYPALAREYASDGKHLNVVGSRRAAAYLLRTLASAAD